MIDALQVIVRGFEETERGNTICGFLTANGFEIETCFDGESDDLGGLIETNIVHQDDLCQSDPDVILAELRQRTGFSELWIQTREFELADDGEYGRDDDGNSDEPEGVVSDEQIKRKLIAMAQAGEAAPSPESALGQLLAAYTDPNARISPAKLAKLRADCFPSE